MFGTNIRCGWKGIWFAAFLLMGFAAESSLAEEIDLVSEDVLYCPDLALNAEYQAHIEGIIQKRREVCAKVPMERYPEVEDFFGIKFGSNETLEEFRENERKHYPELLNDTQLQQVLAFSSEVKDATGKIRSQYPLTIDPRIQAKSFVEGGKSVIEISVQVPSQLYRVAGELKEENGQSVLYLTVTRPSDQQLFASPEPEGLVSTRIESDQPLPEVVTLKWRTLFDTVPFNIAFSELGQLNL